MNYDVDTAEALSTNSAKKKLCFVLQMKGDIALTKDKTICLRMEAELYSALEEIADDWGIKVSALIRKLLLMYVFEHRKGYNDCK